MIKELAKKNRSYRRFYENKKITEDELKELVDTGRNTPSAANRQPVRYKLVCDEVMNEKVFECLGWEVWFGCGRVMCLGCNEDVCCGGVWFFWGFRVGVWGW